MNRHPVLRTSFDLTTYSEPLQLVYADVFPAVEIIDLRHLSGEDQESGLASWFDEMRFQKHELNRAPLIKFYVHILGPGLIQFSQREHHAILDGWSVASMEAELFQNYSDLVNGRKENHLILESRFCGYVARERESLGDQNDRTYWQSLLEDMPTAKLLRWPDKYLKDEKGVHTFSTECDKLIGNNLKTPGI